MPSESDHPSLPESPLEQVSAGGEEGASPVAGTGYRVRLTSFEGPLDLLLHLIRVNEIDLFNIPIVSITRQYNETLDLMRELNLEVAGEYLVMAATLLHIKSKMLLPPDPAAAVSGPSDPRAELVRQLEEYRRYREVAFALGQAEFEQNRSWSRPASLVTGFEGEAAVVADLFSLLGAFKRILDTLSRQEQLALKRERISLLDRIHWVLDRLREVRRAPFSSLFLPGASRADLIVTFLAVLELIRLQVIGAAQDVRFGEIEIVLLEEPDQIRIDAERVLDA
jgi:segregation and condensation protein A